MLLLFVFIRTTAYYIYIYIYNEKQIRIKHLILDIKSILLPLLRIIMLIVLNRVEIL